MMIVGPSDVTIMKRWLELFVHWRRPWGRWGRRSPLSRGGPPSGAAWCRVEDTCLSSFSYNGTSPIPAHRSRFEIQTLLDFLSAAVDMQQWQFFPALMKLARSGLSSNIWKWFWRQFYCWYRGWHWCWSWQNVFSALMKLEKSKAFKSRHRFARIDLSGLFAFAEELNSLVSGRRWSELERRGSSALPLPSSGESQVAWVQLNCPILETSFDILQQEVMK